MIGATLESIFQQSYENIERIVIDGGSTDGTLEYLESVRNKLSVLISESDKGIYDAMNKGIAAAKGDYLIFINAGDRLINKDVLKNVMTKLTAESRPKIISGRVQFEYKGELLNFFRPTKPGKEGLGLPHQATFIDVTLQKENPFDIRFKYVGDYELWRRFQAKGLYEVCYIEDVISVFSIGGMSTAAKNDAKRYLERAYIDYLYSNKFDLKDWMRFFSKVIVRRIMHGILNGKLFFIMLRSMKNFIS